MLLLDHIVFLVKDLEKSIKEFQQAGYTVSKGGKHDNGITENALIHFQNGTFLELLAVQKNWKTRLIRWGLQFIPSFRQNPSLPIPDFKARFIARALFSKEGMVDFCLLAKNGLSDYEDIKNRNLQMSIPVEMKRVRPDGQALSWHIFSPYEATLPFVMTPYQPTFTPNPDNLIHTNGAVGFDKISVYVTDFEHIIKKYELLLGTAPAQKDEICATFELGRGKIEIVSSHQHLGRGIGFLEASPLLLPNM